MKINLQYLYIIIFSLVITSCEQEYNLSNDDFQSRIVVKSLFENNKPWEVNLTNSRFILDDTDKIRNIDGAKVIIHDENDLFLYKLSSIGNGVYSNINQVPIPGNTYYIHVHKDGFEKVTAKGVCPPKPRIQIKNKEIISFEGEERLRFEIEISEDVVSDNYYFWELSKDKNRDNDTIYNLNINDIDDNPNLFFDKINDKFINAEGKNSTRLSSGTLIYTNQGLQGGKSGNQSGSGSGSGGGGFEGDNIADDTGVFNNSVNNGDSGTDNENGGFGDLKDYNIKIITLSKDFYSHIQSLANSKQGNSSIHGGHEYKTNIKGGLGIFAGYNQASFGLE